MLTVSPDGIVRAACPQAHRACRAARRPAGAGGSRRGAAAFATLDPDDQEVLELRVVAGLSSEEVAAALGKRPGAIRIAQSADSNGCNDG